MRVLGLDLGTKTLGLAITDKTGTIPNFLKVIRYDGNTDNLIPELSDIIINYDIKLLVLGLPKNMNNSLGFASQRSLVFKEKLEKNFDLQVELIDERLSTVEAEKILINADTRRNKRKKVIDGLAATIILEQYLNKKGI